jgi:hypothetical protein
MTALLEPKHFYKFMFHWGWNVRKSFHYLYYFQFHRILLDDKEAVDDMKNTMNESMSNLGFDAKEL